MHFALRRAARGLIAGAALATSLMPGAVHAQLFLTAPEFRGTPVRGDEPGLGVPVPGATPEELRAHVLWNTRAGLNVAALQCQFSPYLNTVDIYNDMLQHHQAELADAYAVLNKYFKRVHGAKGQTLFDQYNTVTYNGWSTLEAQIGFCQTASEIGREVLYAPKGGMSDVAVRRLREFRNSLTPYRDPVLLTANVRAIDTTIPPLEERCWKGLLLRKRCGGTA